MLLELLHPLCHGLLQYSWLQVPSLVVRHRVRTGTCSGYGYNQRCSVTSVHISCLAWQTGGGIGWYTSSAMCAWKCRGTPAYCAGNQHTGQTAGVVCLNCSQLLLVVLQPPNCFPHHCMWCGLLFTVLIKCMGWQPVDHSHC